MKRTVHSSEVFEAVRVKLLERGVTIEDIAKVTYEMQSKYNPELTMTDCTDSVKAVLRKREIQHAMLVGIELDVLAEKGLLSEPLLSLVQTDEPLFGCDETLAFGSVLGYGSIAVTTFGHLDKEKIGIIRKLDTKVGERVNTFLDDLVASLAAAASSRIAHRFRDQEEEQDSLDQEDAV